MADEVDGWTSRDGSSEEREERDYREEPHLANASAAVLLSCCYE